MRRILPYALALPIFLTAGCGSPTQEVPADTPTVTETVYDEGDGPESEGTEFAFGEGAAFPHSVGAYEEEFQDGVEEDVVYTVDDVSLDGAGQVGFTLTVAVPQLGRVFGTGNLDVRCSYEEFTEPATTEARLGELEVGAHTTHMVCEAPETPDTVLISVTNGADQANFRGPVE
jgi:hypothetical protein